MSLQSRTAFRLALASGGLAAMIMLAAPTAHAEGAGPFEALAGSWSGNGTASTSDGGRERVRCIAKYAPQSSGHRLGIDLRCASDAYKVEFIGTIVETGEALSGTWFESTRRVGGKISGKASGNQFNVRADGETFTALLSVKTQGNHQIFDMESPGAWVPRFSIALNRGSQ
jgi:hypothetical protein